MFCRMSSPWHSRGYLPHFDQPGILQSVTFRLADSLPHDVLQRLLRRTSADEAERRRHIESQLDAGIGSCVLREPRCALAMEDALLLRDGHDYRLAAWAVMPNHVHVLIAVGVRPLATIVKEWKGASARAVNQILGRSGTLWQREYWDRFIRDERHFQRTIAYIEENPVSARLVSQATAWRWSSAWRRLPLRSEPIGNHGGPAD